MKFSLVRIEPEALRPEDAAEFVGISRTQLFMCSEAGWIKPMVRGNRMTLYRTSALRLLVNRIEAEGGLPRGKEEIAPC